MGGGGTFVFRVDCKWLKIELCGGVYFFFFEYHNHKKPATQHDDDDDQLGRTMGDNRMRTIRGRGGPLSYAVPARSEHARQPHAHKHDWWRVKSVGI